MKKLFIGMILAASSFIQGMQPGPNDLKSTNDLSDAHSAPNQQARRRYTRFKLFSCRRRCGAQFATIKAAEQHDNETCPKKLTQKKLNTLMRDSNKIRLQNDRVPLLVLPKNIHALDAKKHF